MSSTVVVPRLELSRCWFEDDVVVDITICTTQFGNLKRSDRIVEVNLLEETHVQQSSTDIASSYRGSPLSQSSSRRIKPFPTKIKSLTIATDPATPANEPDAQEESYFLQQLNSPVTHTLFCHDSRIAGRYHMPGVSSRTSFLKSSITSLAPSQCDLDQAGESDKPPVHTPRSSDAAQHVPLLRRSVLSLITCALSCLICGGCSRKVTPSQ
jgi:hypothetical protein